MLTQNYYNMIANMLGSAGTVTNYDKGLPVIGPDGTRRKNTFVFDANSYPYSINATPRISSDLSQSGIFIGSGNTPATLADINLESPITSGASMSLSSTIRGQENGPFIEYMISIANTGSSELTVREIGLFQKFSTKNCLMDRTVLDTPLVIQPGDAGVIKYRLQADSSRVKSGVKLVPFATGTDEEIAAMIDAARQGTIDLQADAGWRVGDYRRIHVDAWTGGGDTAHAAQDFDITITQFGDYNNCGCLFQFDFDQGPTETQRMSATATNSGGYGATEMYTTTLPALVEALPSWLKTRLKTFDVLASAGSKSSEIETISNNKLALRSAEETDDYYGKLYAYPGEGDPIDFYLPGGECRRKNKGYSGNTASYWYRSPYKGDNSGFVCYYDGTANPMQRPANKTNTIFAPFGCL